MLDKHLLWGGVAVIAIVMTAFTALTLMHVDATPLMNAVALIIMPIVSVLFLGAKVDKVAKQNETIQQQVNGHMGTVLAKIPDPVPPTATEEATS